MKIIHLKIEDENKATQKELDILKHELGFSSNKQVVKHLIHTYRKTIGNTVLNYESRSMYEFRFSDGSITSVMLSESELIEYKAQKHCSPFLNEDVMVVNSIKL